MSARPDGGGKLRRRLLPPAEGWAPILVLLLFLGSALIGVMSGAAAHAGPSAAVLGAVVAYRLASPRASPRAHAMTTVDVTTQRSSATPGRAGIRLLGPAFVAAVAYVDPGNFATNFTSGTAMRRRAAFGAAGTSCAGCAPTSASR